MSSRSGVATLRRTAIHLLLVTGGGLGVGRAEAGPLNRPVADEADEQSRAVRGERNGDRRSADDLARCSDGILAVVDLDRVVFAVVGRLDVHVCERQRHALVYKQTGCYSTGSRRPHRCRPLANNVEYIDRRQV